MWAAAKSICSSSISVDLLDVEVIELLLVCQCSFVSLCRISVFVFFFFFLFLFSFWTNLEIFTVLDHNTKAKMMVLISTEAMMQISSPFSKRIHSISISSF